MSQFHRQVERRIKKKDQEIQELTDERETLVGRVAQIDAAISAAQASIAAYRETLDLAPRDGQDEGAESELRPGSLPALAYDALKAHEAPLHVTELLAAMNRDPKSRSARTSLSGSLSAYVRRGEIFTRTAPNTFGLVEWSAQGATSPKPWDIEDGVSTDEEAESEEPNLGLQ